MFSIDFSAISNWFVSGRQPIDVTTTTLVPFQGAEHDSAALVPVRNMGQCVAQEIGTALVAVVPGALVAVGGHVANTVGTALATLGTRELSVLGGGMATEIKPIGTEMIVFGSECNLVNDSIIQGASTLFSPILDDEGYSDLMFFLIALVLFYIESKNIIF